MTLRCEFVEGEEEASGNSDANGRSRTIVFSVVGPTKEVGEEDTAATAAATTTPTHDPEPFVLTVKEPAIAVAVAATTSAATASAAATRTTTTTMNNKKKRKAARSVTVLSVPPPPPAAARGAAASPGVPIRCSSSSVGPPPPWSPPPTTTMMNNLYSSVPTLILPKPPPTPPPPHRQQQQQQLCIAVPPPLTVVAPQLQPQLLATDGDRIGLLHSNYNSLKSMAAADMALDGMDGDNCRKSAAIAAASVNDHDGGGCADNDTTVSEFVLLDLLEWLGNELVDPTLSSQSASTSGTAAAAVAEAPAVRYSMGQVDYYAKFIVHRSRRRLASPSWLESRVLFHGATLVDILGLLLDAMNAIFRRWGETMIADATQAYQSWLLQELQELQPLEVTDLYGSQRQHAATMLLRSMERALLRARIDLEMTRQHIATTSSTMMMTTGAVDS